MVITQTMWQGQLNLWARGLERLAQRLELRFSSKDEYISGRGWLEITDLYRLDDSLQIKRLALRVRAGARRESARLARQLAHLTAAGKLPEGWPGAGFQSWLELDEPLDSRGEGWLEDPDTVCVLPEWFECLAPANPPRRVR